MAKRDQSLSIIAGSSSHRYRRLRKRPCGTARRTWGQMKGLAAGG